MSDPTPELVRAFWAFLSEHYQSKVLDKSSDPEMRAVAEGLHLLGIQDQATFLGRFYTTIGHSIWIPYPIGNPPNGDLWGQMLIGVHEHVHVWQYNRAATEQSFGGIGFQAEYLASAGKRAIYEGEAYGSTDELNWWRFGSFSAREPDSTKILENLRHYGCGAEDIATCGKYLAMRREIIQQGVLLTDPARVAVAWLNQHAPFLRSV